MSDRPNLEHQLAKAGKQIVTETLRAVLDILEMNLPVHAYHWPLGTLTDEASERIRDLRGQLHETDCIVADSASIIAAKYADRDPGLAV